MHHLRRLRVPVPGRHPAPPHHHRPAPRRHQHRRLGRPYGTKLFLALEQIRQRPRPAPPNATNSSPRHNSPSSTARRNTASGSAAWAPTTPTAARSSPTSPASWTTSAPPSASSTKRNAPATPPAASATTSSSSTSPNPTSKPSPQKGQKDRRHLPPLRPHHLQRLARIRHRPRNRTPQRILARHADPACPQLTTCNQQPATQSSTTTPATSAATSHLRRAPRRRRAAGQLVEAPRNHERSFCCGAGGGLAFLGEEKGDARLPRPRPAN